MGPTVPGAQPPSEPISGRSRDRANRRRRYVFYITDLDIEIEGGVQQLYGYLEL